MKCPTASVRPGRRHAVAHGFPAVDLKRFVPDGNQAHDRAVTAFAPRSLRSGSVSGTFLRVIALCVVVALAGQTGQCPLDSCDEDLAGQAAVLHISAADTGACHNCICIGTTFVEPVHVLPPEIVTIAAFLRPDGVTEAHAGEPFLPPRSLA
jgi:hypothetical protein